MEKQKAQTRLLRRLCDRCLVAIKENGWDASTGKWIPSIWCEACGWRHGAFKIWATPPLGSLPEPEPEPNGYKRRWSLGPLGTLTWSRP